MTMSPWLVWSLTRGSVVMLELPSVVELVAVALPAAANSAEANRATPSRRRLGREMDKRSSAMVGFIAGVGGGSTAGLFCGAEGFLGHQHLYAAQVAQGIGILRVGMQCHLQRIAGHFQPPCPDVFGGQVVPGLGKFRVARGHVAINGDGFFVT